MEHGDEEYVQVKIQVVPIESHVLLMTGPDTLGLNEDKDVKLSFLRVKVNEEPEGLQWYRGVGKRDLNPVEGKAEVADLEAAFASYQAGRKE